MKSIIAAAAAAAALGLTGMVAGAFAQDRLPNYPGAANFQAWAPKIATAIKPGIVTLRWDDNSHGFVYAVGPTGKDGKPDLFHFDLVRGFSSRVGDSSGPMTAPAVGSGRPGSDLSGRGAYAREHEYASPDATLKAFSRNRNLYLAKADGSDERALTADGSVTGRIRNGQPTYVYTEELAMGRSIWWSPDGTKLAYMRFDESRVPDYPLQLDQTKLYSTTRTIAYPSPGSPNPVPDLFVYDLKTGKTTHMNARAGQPFSDEVVGHYLWAVTWAPDSSEIRLRRANRAQNLIEWIGCAPAGGACRTIVREAHPESWATMGQPTFLKDNRRFLLRSDRTGWDNYYLYDVSGQLIRPITQWTGFEVGNIVRVDEGQGVLWYMARDGDNFMKMQLHRVGLDGKDDVRLTDPAFNHAVSLAPDGKSFVDTIQTHDIPPSTRVVRVQRNGKTEIAGEIAKSDLSAYDAARLKRVEMYTFTAADGQTQLQGMISFPHDFDPAKKYPVLVNIYGGPETNEASETFQMPDPLSEYGFLVVKADLRSASGRGKTFVNAIYGQVGQVEVDDQAAAIRALWDRPYVNKARVGIYGTSYGGSMAAWSLLRYPDVFAAAASSSPVTDHRLYDSTYSERYMGLLPANAEGYARTSAMTYAPNLKGALLIYYGTADDNVHPKNALSLIQALQKAGKHFEVQVGPDLGHTGVNTQRMMEFFIENLVIHPAS